MRSLVLLAGILPALLVLVVVSGDRADGALASAVARTPLERSVFHDQSAAGTVMRPPFSVDRVRCVVEKGFCNVLRRTDTRRVSRVELSRVRLDLSGGARAWRYRGVDSQSAAARDRAREGRLVWGISATSARR